MKRPAAVLLTTILLAASAFVPTAASALTSSKTVIASDDTYVVSSARTTNYASATTLRVDASPVMKSYLRFILPTIGGSITKAMLRLTPAANVNAAFDLRGVGSTTWTERGVTYATAPAVGKSIAHSPAALRSGVALSFDVTSAIRSGLRSFALSNLGSSSTILINSSEATTTSRRPTLILTISTPTAARSVRGLADVGTRDLADPARHLDLHGEPRLQPGHRLVVGSIRQPPGRAVRHRHELPRDHAPEPAELHRGNVG